MNTVAFLAEWHTRYTALLYDAFRLVSVRRGRSDTFIRRNALHHTRTDEYVWLVETDSSFLSFSLLSFLLFSHFLPSSKAQGCFQVKHYQLIFLSITVWLFNLVGAFKRKEVVCLVAGYAEQGKIQIPFANAVLKRASGDPVSSSFSFPPCGRQRFLMGSSSGVPLFVVISWATTRATDDGI